MSAELIRAEWRTGRDVVGIVLGRTAMGKLRAYMGVGGGANKQVDMYTIAMYGCKLSFLEAKAFFPEISEEEYHVGS